MGSMTMKSTLDMDGIMEETLNMIRNMMEIRSMEEKRIMNSFSMIISRKMMAIMESIWMTLNCILIIKTSLRMILISKTMDLMMREILLMWERKQEMIIAGEILCEGIDGEIEGSEFKYSS